MANNIQLNTGSGGAVMATDEISTAHYQKVKMGFGTAGAVTMVDSSNGMPVAQQGSWTVGITGTVPLPSGAATAANQPGFGTAGTPHANVLSVQGIASMTPLKVDGSAVTQPISAAVGSPAFVRLSDGTSAITNLAMNLAQIGGTSATANSGNAGNGTLRVVIATDQPAYRVSASDETSTIYNGQSVLTPKFAFANIAAAQTDSNIITAVSGKKIRVHSLAVVCGASGADLTFNTKGGSAGNPISPLFANGGNGGEVLPYSKVGWFETVSGQGLTCTTGAGSATGILVVYSEV